MKKQICAGEGAGWATAHFPVLGHDITGCIVPQDSWGHMARCDMASSAVTRPCDTAQQRCDTAGLRTEARGSARMGPGHRGVSRYNFLYRDRGCDTARARNDTARSARGKDLCRDTNFVT